MNNIRPATKDDVCRISEIIVFNNRMNFFPIFNDEEYSFKFFNVSYLMNEYLSTPEVFSEIYVYDDGIIRGFVHVHGEEVKKLYVEHFFQNRGYGHELLQFAVNEKGADHLWALEKNEKALRFYSRHGFFPTGEWRYEDDTTEKLIVLKKK
ncbi:MAG: GNAT family N-acetyltransferase [Eubacteriaceae bacterium]|nr:GNAT family N-acetyltransferase [Eubacteriaceae bacterium]